MLKTAKRIDHFADDIGTIMVSTFHTLALFAIGSVVVWSATIAFLGMTAKGSASIEDILLLFIYLELGAMVGIYFATKNMPVRFLIYVAITALTRLMVGNISINHKADWDIVLISGAILLLAIASLVLRFGSHNYPSKGLGNRGEKGAGDGASQSMMEK